MGDYLLTLISYNYRESLNELLLMMPAEQRDRIHDISQEIESKAVPLAKGKKRTGGFLEKVEAIFASKTSALSQKDQKSLRRALVAKLALKLSSTVEKLDLPGSILALYPKAFERLVNHLKNNESDAYDITDDFFRKDISFVLGLSVPCGAQVVETTSYFLYRSVIRALTRPGNLSSVVRFFQVRGAGPWFGIHTETRYLKDFSEAGWDACYIRIADLLEQKPLVRGMIGTSWFYDPQLLSISPHLAYLQRRPLERGAFMIRHGTCAIDIERATLKSQTRRLLYEEGKYRPVSYSLLWPRKELICWAIKERIGKRLKGYSFNL